MSTISTVAIRIYERGRYAPEDFAEVAPDEVILRGIKPPTVRRASGLVLPGGMSGDTEQRDHPVRACAAFEVVMLPGSMSKGNPLALEVGDVVMCRNALVDPLLGNELASTNLYLGIVAVLERAPKVEG